ncbi:MAG TPA: hypothetical protein VFX26_03910 [Nitrososphaeraceae archaeon]|nr:hypothetical protein [Nitrososphaeraceae archaeon]
MRQSEYLNYGFSSVMETVMLSLLRDDILDQKTGRRCLALVVKLND